MPPWRATSTKRDKREWKVTIASSAAAVNQLHPHYTRDRWVQNEPRPPSVLHKQDTPPIGFSGAAAAGDLDLFSIV